VSPRLAAYLERLGLAAAPFADAAGVEALQVAHRLAIPFENFDVLLGRPIAVDSAGAFAKLVTARRGGYCFEHNRVLADMLGEIGVATRPLLARVLLGPPGDTPPRTHVLLLAELPDGAWIADAGFGGSAIPLLRLAAGAEAAAADGARYRLRRCGSPGALAGEYLLERTASPGGWQPQYSFDLAEVAAADIEQANHWTATAPASRFTRFHIATRALPDGLVSLVDRTLTVTRNGQAEVREIDSRQAYGKVLADMVGLALTPADLARLRLF
jgi:N-hydroxyarylamine O-acetyltransferase